MIRFRVYGFPVQWLGQIFVLYGAKFPGVNPVVDLSGLMHPDQVSDPVGHGVDGWWNHDNLRFCLRCTGCPPGVCPGSSRGALAI